MKNITLLPALALFMFMHGCAIGLKHTPMKPVTHDSIESIEVYNLVIQDEIRPYSQTGTAGGGFLGVAISASRNAGEVRDAHEITKPVYDATGDFNYRKVLAENINAALSKNYDIESPRSTAEAVLLSPDRLNQKITALEPGEALLYLSTFYQFVHDSRAVGTTTHASLYIPQKPDKPVYYNYLNFRSEVVGGGDEESIALWSVDDGARFRRVLTKSTEETARALIYDMQPDRDETCAKKVRTKPEGATFHALSVKGRLVDMADGYGLIRHADGSLHSSSHRMKQYRSRRGKPAECDSEGGNQ